MSRIVIASLVVVAAFVSGGRVSTAQETGTAAAAVPKAVRDLLDDKWQGWRLATVDNTGACAATLNGRSPSFVRADLNGDGVEDVALQITTGDVVRIVAVISRIKDDIAVVEVDQLQGTASEVLGFAPRGQRYSRADMYLSDFFPTDTLTTSRCEKTATAYLWTGNGFLKRAVQF